LSNRIDQKPLSYSTWDPLYWHHERLFSHHRLGRPEVRPSSAAGTLSAAGDGETPRKSGIGCLAPSTLRSTAFYLITP